MTSPTTETTPIAIMTELQALYVQLAKLKKTTFTFTFHN